MVSVKRGIKYLFNNRLQFLDSIIRNGLAFLPDKWYLSLRYRCQQGTWINWSNPKFFTEKIQWLKLYDREPQYTIMVDKYAVKRYVADRIGEEYVIPILGVWDKPEDIEWSELPEQFVLKTTDGGGSCGVIVCKDRSSFDCKDAVRNLKNALKSDIYRGFREWPYKNVRKRIIAEKFMMSPCGVLADYKFYCFNGVPHYCQVIRDRHCGETIDFYDMNWQHQEFVGLNPVARNGLNPVARNGLNPVARPVCLEEMVELCRKLSEGIPFLRVDLYAIEDKAYFGELTFFPASGFGIFEPEEWNVKLGDLIKLRDE